MYRNILLNIHGQGNVISLIFDFKQVFQESFFSYFTFIFKRNENCVCVCVCLLNVRIQLCVKTRKRGVAPRKLLENKNNNNAWPMV